MENQHAAIAEAIAQLKQELPAFAGCSIELIEVSASWASATIRTKDRAYKMALKQSSLGEGYYVELEDCRGNRLNSNGVCVTLAEAIAQLRQAAEGLREALR